jgi:hypothetical protein
MEGRFGAAGRPAGRGRRRLLRASQNLAPSRDARSYLRAVACEVFAGWLAAFAIPSIAHPLTLQECFEGGDFIAHAAQARDNGMSKAAFNDKLLADINLIKTFPRELRWFVQDPDDAEFLLAEATTVFDRPRPPEAHRRDFLSRCFDRDLEAGPSSPSETNAGPGFRRANPDPSPGP